MGHHHEFHPAPEQFTPSDSLRRILMGMMGIGVLAIVFGLFTNPDRFWANFLLNNWYFMGLGLMGTLFLSTQAASNAGWSTGFKRIPEAMAGYLPVAYVGMGVLLLALVFHWNHLYHWAVEGIADPGSQHYDEIIAEKVAYLNVPFMVGRVLVIFTLWYLFTRAMRRNSLLEDEIGGVKMLKRNKTLGVIFLPVFAVSWAMSSWDWLMSLDAHWYSTIFWVYQFAASWVTAISVITFTVILLRRAGHLKMVTNNHLHDLGKFMFAFSIFWTYIWISQYLLIFYANIPEETIYFQERFEHFEFLFLFNIVINFLAPFFLLMTRGSKRNDGLMLAVALVIIIGKWIDLYLGIMPGTLGAKAGIGFIEIGMFVGFAGLFGWVLVKGLSSVSLVPAKHPFLKEFAHHEVL